MSLLDKSLGAYFIGAVGAGVLWGITCLQVFHYYTTRPKDSVYIKSLVALAWTLDSAHQVLIFNSLYRSCVTYYGDLLFLLAADNVRAVAENCLLMVIGMIVQSFYVFKIWKLSETNKLYVAPVLFLILCEFVANAIFNYQIIHAPHNWILLLAHARKAGLACAVCALVTDLTITCMMCYLLQRGAPQFSRSKSIVNRLVVFVISSNMLTTSFALGLFIIYIVLPYDLYVIPLFHIIARLYANSFLASLNTRPFMRSRRDAPTEVNVDMPLSFAFRSRQDISSRGDGSNAYGSDRLDPVRSYRVPHAVLDLQEKQAACETGKDSERTEWSPADVDGERKMQSQPDAEH